MSKYDRTIIGNDANGNPVAVTVDVYRVLAMLKGRGLNLVASMLAFVACLGGAVGWGWLAGRQVVVVMGAG